MVERTLSIGSEVLLAHTDWVRRLAQRLVLDAAGADDVAQQTMLHALEREGAEVRHPRAWLASIARSLARRLRRAQERRATHEARVPTPRGPEAAAEIVARASLHRAVVEAVLTLSEPYRSTILVRFFEDVDAREVAARLDVPVETVRTRLKRGLALLREKLDASKNGRDYALLAAPLVAAGAVATAAKLAAAAAIVAVLGIGTWKLLRHDDVPASAHDVASAPPATARVQAVAANGAATETAATPTPAPATVAASPSRIEEPAVAATPSLAGVVRDASGAPVSDAFVFVEDAEGGEDDTFHDAVSFAEAECSRTELGAASPWQATTAADGSYFVKLPHLGRWCVGVIHMDRGYAWRSGIRSSEQAPDARSDLELRPGLVLFGEVRDEQGAPIFGAVVGIEAKRSGGTVTLGHFSTGKYGCWFTPPLSVRELVVADVRHLGHYRAPRVDVAIEPGEQRHRLDFTLTRAPILRGRLLGPDGMAADLTTPGLERLKVRICAAGQDGRPNTCEGDSAIAHVDASHATFEFSPDAPGGDFVTAEVNDTVLAWARLTGDRDDLDLILDLSHLPPAPAPGSHEPPRGRWNVLVVASDAAQGTPLTGYSLSWDDARGNRWGRGCQAPDGVFSLGAVPAGRCEITVAKAHYAPATQTLEIADDEEGERRIEFALAPLRAEVKGRVTTADLRPLEGVHVLALDEKGTPLLAFPDGQEWSDARGGFSIGFLQTTPGLLVVEDDAHAPLVVRCTPSEDPTPLALTLEPGVLVTLHARDADRAIDVEAAWQLRITDERGLPVVDNAVAGRRTPAARDGAIVLRLAPGRYSAKLDVPGFLTARSEFRAADDTTLEMDLVRLPEKPGATH